VDRGAETARWCSSVSHLDQTAQPQRGYALRMAKPVDLTAAELGALRALIDGRRQPSMSREIKQRLSELHLIERREWPYGPPWRTALGKRVVREGGVRTRAGSSSS
jgi:hypothetical protein